MKDPLIQNWFSQTAAKFSTKVALESENHQITYQRLEQESNNLANFLLSQGTKKGSFVFILSQNCFVIIPTLIACLKAGFVFVPLGGQLPQKRLQNLVSDIAPQWIIADRQEIKNIQALKFNNQPNLLFLDKNNQNNLREANLKSDRTTEYLQFWQPENPQIDLELDDMCYLYFTSGSTGKAKAIAGRLKSIGHFVNWEINTLKLNPRSRVSQLINPAFDAFLRDIFVPLCSGGIVYIPENYETILDSKKLVQWLDAQQINLIHCVPSLFRSLLTQDLDPNKFQNLRYILLSGEPLLPADVSQWMQIYGERIQLVNLYGASETTMTKFFYFVQASDRAKQTIPIGKPMDGTAAIIVGQNGKICPPGIVGEIYIRTPYRTLGYYQQPELTQEVFIPNPFTNKPHDIVYKTGDLGRILQDGNFEYLGRKDRQVKIRGIRIELAEIENALSRHPQIQEAVVQDWEDRQGNKYLCGYLLVKEPLKSHQIREFLVDWLAEPKIPTIFTIMDRLPKTISGKIDRKSLPEPQAQERIRPLIRPRNPIEEELVKIWEQVLKVNPIGIEDNFFALGGHSLLVTQLTALVEQSFKVKLPLKIPFESPQLAKMAGIIQKLQDSQFNPSKSSQNQGSTSLFSSQSPAKETTQSISKVSRPAKLPLSFAAARLWFMEQLNPHTSAYNMPIVIRLQGTLNIAALEKSFNAIITRHEILRTTFRIAAGEPVQVIIPHLTLPLKKS